MRHRRLPAAALVAAVATLASSCGSSGPGRSSAPTAPARPVTTTTTAPPTRLSAVTAPWRLPDPVSRPVVLAGGSGFAVLGGLATGDTSTSRIIQVDPASGSAGVAGALAVAVHDSAGAALGGTDYVFGGGSYSTVSTVQAWSGGGAARPVGHLPAGRSDLAAVTAGSTAYVVGGFDGSVMDPQVLATTDGTTFKTVASLPVPVRYPAVAFAAGALWVLGGVTSTSESGAAETSAIQRIDPATGAAAVVGHLPRPMGHATAVVLDGWVFLLGGRSGAVPSATIWRLDPATATVQPAGTLPQAVSDAGSVVVGGTAYLVGGEVTGPTAPLDTVVVLRPVA